MDFDSVGNSENKRFSLRLVSNQSMQISKNKAIMEKRERALTIKKTFSSDVKSPAAKTVTIQEERESVADLDQIEVKIDNHTLKKEESSSVLEVDLGNKSKYEELNQ